VVKTLLALVALVGLAACSNAEKLATPTGPVFALNPGHWQPTPADLQIPKPDRS
jgi:Outer membrane lipoprotein virB7